MIFEVEPIFNYRTWGGDYLKSCLGRTDIKDPIGEVFSVCCLPQVESLIDGVPFGEFYRTYPEYFGLKTADFPLCINLIEAVDDLSVQLHPIKENLQGPNNYRGIEEAWYILKTVSKTEIVIGLTTNDINKVKIAIDKNNWSDILKVADTQVGDFIFLPAGCVHAIRKGNLVYEVTYNQDITYRLYDYQRVDAKTGQFRDLHHKEGLENLSFKEGAILSNTQAKSGVSILLQQKPGFRIERIKCEKEMEIGQDNFYFYTIIAGAGMINEMPTGLFKTFFIPKVVKKVEIKGTVELLRTSFMEANDE